MLLTRMASDSPLIRVFSCAAQIHLKLHLRNGLSKMGDQGARIINVPVEFVLQTDQGIRVHLGCLARLPLTVETLPLSIGERVSLARPAPGRLGREGVEGIGYRGVLAWPSSNFRYP
ncbi:hypothetical protein L4V63_0008210 [Pseudomonas aeruginosa]|nr:hypothetical protein [Pseudomonas aeruginosa]